MVKKSFFDKLVGNKSDSFGDNDQEFQEIETNEEETPQLSLDEETTIEPPIAHEAMATSKVRTRQVTPQPQDDLLNQDEGQLTLDVFQTPSEIIIKSTVAGVKPEDIDIAINNDMVTVRGRREKEEEVNTKDYYYQELYWGTFSRSVILPVEVDADEASASLKNGILTIHLPKLDRAKNKKVRVKME